MSNYTLRKLNENEFDLLIPLMQDSFGMEVNLDYFKWKYIANPAGKFIGFVAIDENGEVGAYYGVIPQLYSIDEVETVIYQSCDTMTHSNHRRRGLFQKLALMCYDYLRQNEQLFVVGFSGAQSTPGFIKFGWSHLFDVKNYFFPRLFGQLNLLGYKEASGVRYLNQDKAHLIEHLTLKSNASANIHSFKKSDFFKWRISNPRYNYQLLIVENGAGISSFLCFYEDGNKLVLFDFYFESKKEGAQLLDFLKKKMLDERKIGIIAYCQEGSHYAQELGKFHFISNPTKRGPLAGKTPFIILAEKETMDKFKSPLLWNVNSFDHDAM